MGPGWQEDDVRVWNSMGRPGYGLDTNKTSGGPDARGSRVLNPKQNGLDGSRRGVLGSILGRQQDGPNGEPLKRWQLIIPVGR